MALWKVTLFPAGEVSDVIVRADTYDVADKGLCFYAKNSSDHTTITVAVFAPGQWVMAKRSNDDSPPMAGDDLREALADLAHKQWSNWVECLFLMGGYGSADGSWVMRGEFFDRWTRKMKTPYGVLSEREKERSRVEADRVLEVIGG